MQKLLYPPLQDLENPIDPFTILEPDNPSIEELNVVRKRRSMNNEIFDIVKESGGNEQLLYHIYRITISLAFFLRFPSFIFGQLFLSLVCLVTRKDKILRTIEIYVIS